MNNPLTRLFRVASDRLVLLLDAMRTSFWVLPLALMVAALLLAALVIWLDSHVFPGMTLSSSDWWNVSELDSIRSLLSTTAASVLGVAGVSFSITIASLTLASQQFGPRLIRTFMQDRFTQLVLGVFVSTFLFCMVNIHLSSVAVADNYRPVATLLAVMVLTVVNLLMLVLFIHRIAVSIQVDSVIEEVTDEIAVAIQRLPERAAPIERQVGADGSRGHRPPPGAPALLLNPGLMPLASVASPASGYIQLLDREGLVDCARHLDVLVHLSRGIGDHVLEGEPLLHVYPATRASVDETCDESADGSAPDATHGDESPPRSRHRGGYDELAAPLMIGRTRTPVQDLLFPVRQLVEIALRALSPGINDPFTALNCLDRLTEFLVLASQRQLGDQLLRDDDGVIRAYLTAPGFDELLDTCFTRIARAGSDNADVLRRVVDACRSLRDAGIAPDCHPVLSDYVAGLREAIAEAPLISRERAELLAWCDHGMHRRVE